MNSGLRIAVVRHADFARTVRLIVVEFGSASEQSTHDRYIRGENVPIAQLERVWKTTQANPSISADFFAAVREVNSKLTADARVRVFGADPGSAGTQTPYGSAASILKEQVLQKHGKVLLIYGQGHVYRTDGDAGDFLSGTGGGITKTLEADFPGQIFVVIYLGGPLTVRPGIAKGPDPDYQMFDRALKTPLRPVLVSLQRPHFRDFTVHWPKTSELSRCRRLRERVPRKHTHSRPNG